MTSSLKGRRKKREEKSFPEKKKVLDKSQKGIKR